jgi:peptidyl-prolyl isomerase G (cyclophilin G)
MLALSSSRAQSPGLTDIYRFFITLAPCPHLNKKHTVFGQVVSGHETLSRMAKVEVDKDDKPLVEVLVSHCGELERKKKTTTSLAVPAKDHAAASTSRGRHKRRHSSTPERSPSPSRGHTRESGSRHRHRHRRHRRDDSSSAVSRDSITPPAKAEHHKRRSEGSPDHNLRGRPRNRSNSRSKSPIAEINEASPPPRQYRKRSSPPSRPRSKSPGYRRQRSLPNQYRDWREEERLRVAELERDGDRYVEDSSGRLGGGGGWDDPGGNGVKYKGRGAMKFKEHQRWRG